MEQDKTKVEAEARARALRRGIGAVVLLGLSIAWLFFGPELLHLQRQIPDANSETIRQAVAAMQQRAVIVAKWIVPALFFDGLALFVLVLSWKHFRLWSIARQKRLTQ